jgi:hypothetical protein
MRFWKVQISNHARAGFGKGKNYSDQDLREGIYEEHQGIADFGEEKGSRRTTDGRTTKFFDVLV